MDLAQYCGNSSANALELPQSSAKPWDYDFGMAPSKEFLVVHVVILSIYLSYRKQAYLGLRYVCY